MPRLCENQQLISLQTINKFFEEAYANLEGRPRKLHLVTEKQSVTEIHPTVGPVDELSRSQFLGLSGPRAWLDPASYHEELDRRARVFLDADSAEDKITCQLILTDEVIGPRSNVRSDFYSAQIALEAILDGSTNVQRLRNKAAVCGGVLQNYTLEDSTLPQDQISIVKFQNRPPTSISWEQCCQSKMGTQDPMCVPVFCTSDIPLEVRAILRPSNNMRIGLHLLLIACK